MGFGQNMEDGLRVTIIGKPRRSPPLVHDITGRGSGTLDSEWTRPITSNKVINYSTLRLTLIGGPIYQRWTQSISWGCCDGPFSRTTLIKNCFWTAWDWREAGKRYGYSEIEAADFLRCAIQQSVAVMKATSHIQLCGAGG